MGLFDEKPPRFHEGSPEEQWNEYCVTEDHGKDQSLIEFGGAKIIREKILDSDIEVLPEYKFIYDEKGKLISIINTGKFISINNWYGQVTEILDTQFERVNNLLCMIKFHPNAFMGEIFDRMPYGIINKQSTGIGATTLEIECPRNSIIVAPNRALAYDKASKHESALFYVGSAIGDFVSASEEDIENHIKKREQERLQDPKIYTKFIVVADSLPKLLGVIGEKVLDDYFLLIDEIDMVQSDSNFRSKLEDVIDYYFLFDPKKRALVSATVKGFSNPYLQTEPLVIM